jgi:hypothetical protein
VKTENGQLSKIQEHEIRAIRKARGIAGVVRSVPEAVGIVENLRVAASNRSRGRTSSCGSAGSWT